MNTMEMTKFVGAICGSLLVFLVISTLAEALFSTHSEEVAYALEGAEEPAEATEEAPAEDVDVPALMAAADPGAGESIFRRCAACHKVEDGANAVGPHLHAVVGRDIASVEGFAYSEVLTGLEGGWTEDELYAFIGNPKGYAPGTKMAFAGLPKPEDRANVIAYLKSAN